MASPDWDRLKTLAAEAQRLERADGTLARADYERLLAEASNAAGGDDELVEFIENREPA